MHLSKACKAILILVNHAIAVHLPPLDILKSRTRISPERGLWEIGVSARRPTPSNTESQLLIREGGSCDRCARCKKNKIRDPSDCTRCVKCPPSTKPDPTKRTCIPDNKDEREKKFQEKKQKKRAEYRQKKFDQKKAKKKKEWEEKDRIRKDTLNRKKARRMGKCLTIVPLAMGSAAVAEFADNYFQEDLFESIDMDLLEFWPSDTKDAVLDNILDDDVPGDDYIDEWVRIGKNLDRRDISSDPFAPQNEGLGPVVDVSDTRRVYVRSERAFSDRTDIRPYEDYDLSTRQVQFIIEAVGAIIAAIVKIAARVGARAAKAGGKVGSTVSRTSIKIAKPGQAKKSKVEQKEGAKKISQDKNWSRCVTGQGPLK